MASVCRVPQWIPVHLAILQQQDAVPWSGAFCMVCISRRLHWAVQIAVALPHVMSWARCECLFVVLTWPILQVVNSFLQPLRLKKETNEVENVPSTWGFCQYMLSDSVSLDALVKEWQSSHCYSENHCRKLEYLPATRIIVWFLYLVLVSGLTTFMATNSKRSSPCEQI